MSDTTTTASFAENYKILEDAAAELQRLGEADIDKLVPLVERGLAAHKVCDARITHVREMLVKLSNPDAPAT